MPVVHDMQLGFDWGSKQAWRCPASQSMAEAERASLTQLSVRGKHVEATWGDGTIDVIADVSLEDFATMRAGDNVRVPVDPLEDCFAFKRGQLRVRLMEKSSCVRVFLTRLKQPLDKDMPGPTGDIPEPGDLPRGGKQVLQILVAKLGADDAATERAMEVGRATARLLCQGAVSLTDAKRKKDELMCGALDSKKIASSKKGAAESAAAAGGDANDDGDKEEEGKDGGEEDEEEEEEEGDDEEEEEEAGEEEGEGEPTMADVETALIKKRPAAAVAPAKEGAAKAAPAKKAKAAAAPAKERKKATFAKEAAPAKEAKKAAVAAPRPSALRKRPSGAAAAPAKKTKGKAVGIAEAVEDGSVEDVEALSDFSSMS